LIAIAAAAAAVATAAGMLLAVRDDLEVADRYQETLATANGQYLAAEPVTATDGWRAGTAFGYQGEPSWVLVTLYPSDRLQPGVYRVLVTTREGKRVSLNPIRVSREGGAGGSAIPGEFHDVSEVRMVGPGQWNVLRAGFQPG
jgi:hypothetical protein